MKACLSTLKQSRSNPYKLFFAIGIPFKPHCIHISTKARRKLPIGTEEAAMSYYRI